MLPCTIHVGAPKTGSTAIQDALFFSLRHPGFQYIAGGEPNGSLVTEALFQESPENEHCFRRFGCPGGSFARYHARLNRQWIRGMDHAVRRQAHLVISGETLWTAPEGLLERLRDAVVRAGFSPRILGYLRPWAPWIESLWTHRMVHGRGRFSCVSDEDMRVLDVISSVTRLRRVFGEGRVTILPYDRERFERRCAVHDFCRRLGWPVPEGFQILSNEGGSLAAAQLAHCFHRFVSTVPEGHAGQHPGLFRLLGRLRRLTGPTPRLDPALLGPVLDTLEPQSRWIERELGFSMAAASARSGLGSPVRHEDDLFHFEPSTLAWLAREARRPPVHPGSGEDVARTVAREVDHLRTRPCRPDELSAMLRLRLQKRWIRWRHRC